MTEPHAPLPAALDHRTMDWSRVRRATYQLRQTLAYEYPGPITGLRQRLVVVPRAAYGDQRLLRYGIEADGAADGRRAEEIDAFGNRIVRFHLPHVEARVEFRVSLELERSARQGHEPLSVGEAATYLAPTHLTMPDATLVRAAEPFLVPASGGVRDRAERICRWVHGAIRYEHGRTGVRTTAADAVAIGAGVCQDFAHVMIALCRLAGIPARYVSGHLLGEGGTHAWVEVLAPAGAGRDALVPVAYDPTHGRVAGLTYLTIATGRDYRDVAPTTGTFSAPYEGTLTARKSALLTAVEYRDDATALDERGAA